MRSIWQDAKYATRILRKMPGFALAAILTLGLAIGANTAFFSIVNGILLAPLPYSDPDGLVIIANTYGGNRTASSVPDYLDRMRGSTTLQSITAFRPRDFSLTTDLSTAHISGALVTANFFEVLGVRPALGRVFTTEEDQPGANNVIILGNGVWQQYFASDPNIVGKRVTLDGETQTVAGVMPAGFRMPLRDGQIWRPIAFLPAQMSPASRGDEFLTNIGRVAKSTTIEQVRTEMLTFASRAVDNGGARQQFLINAKFSADVSPLIDETIGIVRKPLLVLVAATGLVLLIALANIANLLLARASSRRREIFIRSTLGAARSRIVGQLLTESILLSLIGGIVGVSLAYWSVRSLASLRLAGIPRLDEIGMDYRVITFAFVLSLITGIAFGALPAWSMSRCNYRDANAGTRDTGASGKGVRQAVVMVQVAIAMVLLVGASLLVGSVRRLMAVDPGFKPESRLTFRISLPLSIYPKDESQITFFNSLIERLRQTPGVLTVGISTLSPFDVRNDTATFHVEGVEEGPGSRPFGSELREISREYPAAIGMPLLAGRTFTDQDRSGSPYVVLVDQQTAARFWPGQNPLGKRLRFGSAWREVVGVVGTVKNERLDVQGQYQIYIPYLQSPAPTMTVVVQASADPTAVMRAAREVVTGLNRNVPMFDIRTLEERVRESLAPRRYTMMLLGGFGLAGILVSVIGIYGVLAYAVRERTQEIGIRIALGARRGEVLGMIVAQGLRLALVGIALGSLGSFWLTRFLESMLYGIRSTDPMILMIVASVLLAAALLASYIPARRASHLDPVGALRGE